MTATARRWHRRTPTMLAHGEHTAELVPVEPVELTLVVAVWQAGNAGPVTLTVNGRTIVRRDGGASGIEPIRFDRPERVEAGTVIAVTMPTPGMADVNGDQQ